MSLGTEGGLLVFRDYIMEIFRRCQFGGFIMVGMSSSESRRVEGRVVALNEFLLLSRLSDDRILSCCLIASDAFK
jgi:hypothetical protein